MFDPPASTRLHPRACRCAACNPASPADLEERSIVGTTCLLVLAGMAAGVPIAAAIDALTTRVGLLSVFGS